MPTQATAQATMMDTRTAQRDAPHFTPHTEAIYATVRAGRHASPMLDLTALQMTANILHSTLEELDGACG